ncbi:Cytochrome c-type protein NapC [hydrothermal vent metagenome]|uniref:Cytochrome c-type protein NapC n=1 Tax=hydrothermal vent metagenome TaxID=652676 RepID=A0A3B1AI37_9ZZZZ
MYYFKTIINRAQKIIQRYCNLSKNFPIVVFFSVFLLGILFWTGFNSAMDITNNEEFCISCHEMENNVYQEYKKTVHYRNRTGVRATCPDCHVPKDWIHKTLRKINATNELFHKIVGTIDTKDKFESKRLKLAEYVWQTMLDNDSRECRNCHSFDYMALSKQKKNSNKKHQSALDRKMTCIQCHMGIAHKIAKDFDQDGLLHESFKNNKRPCSDCHKDMTQGDW